MRRTRKVLFSAGALAAGVVAGTAHALPSAPSLRLHPVDGGHWQAHVGLPDARGSAGQALVRVIDGSDGHPEVAAVSGLAGRDTSTIERLGFTVAGAEAGIIPCIRVAFRDGLGTRREVMLTGRMMRATASDAPGWIVYRHTSGLPPGGTIETVEVGIHAESTPVASTDVRFDDVVVNDDVFTQAGDSG